MWYNCYAKSILLGRSLTLINFWHPYISICNQVVMKLNVLEETILLCYPWPSYITPTHVLFMYAKHQVQLITWEISLSNIDTIILTEYLILYRGLVMTSQVYEHGNHKCHWGHTWWVKCRLNSLTTGICSCNSRLVIFKSISRIDILSVSCESVRPGSEGVIKFICFSWTLRSM